MQPPRAPAGQQLVLLWMRSAAVPLLTHARCMQAPGLPGQLALLALVLAASASLLQPAAGQLEASDGTALQDLAAGLGASLPSWTGTLPCSEGARTRCACSIRCTRW